MPALLPARRRALWLLALALVACREPSPPGAPPSSAGGGTPAARSAVRPVQFIGLDGADWTVLDRFMAAGSMPNLSRLVREGSSGLLLTEEPVLSPILWTTMMTGVSPLEHGILDFTAFDVAGRREPIGSQDRRSPAIWNIASAAGLSVGVFGLWATHPAEPVNGVVVSDRLSSFLGPRGTPLADAVYPPERLEAALATRRRIEGELDLAALKRFVPDLAAGELERARSASNPYADPIAGLYRMLLETRLQDDLYRSFIAERSPDLAILYLEASDTAGHLLAPYLAPRPASTPATEFERFQALPERFFGFLDELLGEYRALAEKRGAILFLASDHGFHWLEGRPERTSSSANATAARWHRAEGIYLLHGAGFPARPRDAKPQGIRQVASTLLALLELPPGAGMAMPPIPPVTGPATAPVDYSRKFRQELRAAAAGENAEPPSDDTVANAEGLEKLRALGYLGGAEGDRPSGAASRRSPGSFNNEGLILRAEGRLADARTAFEEALRLDPRFASAEWNLSELLWESGELDRADELLRSALGHDLGDGAARREARFKARLARGRAALEAGDCAPAAAEFERAARLDESRSEAPAAEGLARLCLGDERAAAKAFERSLRLNPAQPRISEALQQLEGPPLH